MGYVYYCARRYGMGRDQAFSLRVLGVTFVAAFPALLTPAIIIGGMMFGLFTPTEAAVAASVWALFLGTLAVFVVTARATGGRLLRLGDLRFRRTWLLLVAPGEKRQRPRGLVAREGYGAGDEIALDVMRDGDRREVAVSLIERPA